jgi:single-strand DNA-binding protein
MSEIAFTGNLVEDIELKFVASGAALGRARVAENRRWKDGNGQQQEATSFHTVIIWRELAENAAESLRKGDRVVVVGRLEQRHYKTEANENRSVWEVTADAFGPDLRWARAAVTKTRSGGNGGGGGGQRPAPSQAQRSSQPVAGDGDFDPYGAAGNDDEEPF